MAKNAILQSPDGDGGGDEVATTIAQRATRKREAQYAEEVRRLLDAGLAVMRECGTSSSPRVADIVAEAGLSNDAFYRHFASKEALVAAILEDGSVRLVSYLLHQMAKATTPEGVVRRWVEGVLAQATDEEVAATTLAVWWNGGAVSASGAGDRPSTANALAALLHAPLHELGVEAPELTAQLCAHAAVGFLSDCLWQRKRPTRTEVTRIVDWCLGAASS